MLADVEFFFKEFAERELARQSQQAGLTRAEPRQAGVHVLVKHPHLPQLVLLLQQNPQQVPAEEAGAAGDQVNEAAPGVGHAAVCREH